MTASSSSTSSSFQSRLNAPRPIFLGWTLMIFVAGTSYWIVKDRNLQKRKEIMRKEKAAAQLEEIASIPTSTSQSGAGHGSKGEGQASSNEQDDEDKQRALARYLAQGEQRRRAEQGQAAVGGSGAGGSQSPLQSLLNQLNRQTSQRKRGGGGDE